MTPKTIGWVTKTQTKDTANRHGTIRVGMILDIKCNGNTFTRTHEVAERTCMEC